MVKYCAFILAITLIWTLTAPCSDAKKASVLTSSHSVNTENGNDHSSSPHSDACGPFCICACCSLSVNYQHANPELQELFNETGVHNSTYHVAAPDDISFAVWQPPQLAC